MAKNTFRISGKVLSDGTGVPGTSLRIWNLGDSRAKDPVREIYTDVKGEFAADLTLPPRTLSPSGSAGVRLTIHDTRGNLLWSSGDKRVSLGVGRDVRRLIRLDGKVVEKHLADVWLPNRKLGLLTKERVSRFRQALTKLGGTPERDAIARRAAQYGVSGLCPAPDFDVVDSLVRDAWRVLDGDPTAPMDFVEKLELVHHLAIRPGNPKGTEMLPAQRRLAVKPKRAFDPDCRDCGSSADPDPLFDSSGNAELGDSILPGGGFLNGDAILVLLMAAKESGFALGRCKGVETALASAKLQVGRVGHLLCLFHSLEPVFRLADESLRNGVERLERLGEITDLIGWECGPDDGPVPVIPWPDPRECFFPELPEIHWIPCLPLQFFSFQIDEVEPAQACAGTLITIRGENFKDDTGEVCFRSAADSDFDLQGQIISWSENTIVVSSSRRCFLRRQG